MAEFGGMLKSTCSYHRPSVAIVIFVLTGSGDVFFWKHLVHLRFLVNQMRRGSGSFHGIKLIVKLCESDVYNVIIV